MVAVVGAGALLALAGCAQSDAGPAPASTPTFVPGYAEPAAELFAPLTGLPAGRYTVRYTDSTGTYLDQCYDDVVAAQSIEPTCDSTKVPAAEVVTVAANATKTLDDQQLHHAGTYLAGTVVNGANAPLKGEATQELDELCRSRDRDGTRVARFNPVDADTVLLFIAVLSGEFAITGFRNRDLRPQVAALLGRV